jgi:hypothetical protein
LLLAHFAFLGNRDIADALRRSQFCIGAMIERITDIEGWALQPLLSTRDGSVGYRQPYIVTLGVGDEMKRRATL